LEDVETMDSSGLSIVIQAWKETRAGGGDLVLAAPPDSVKRVLEITGVDRLLPVCDSVEEACRFLE
ncbi:MAG: anti-sigma factor antagonist, partial [Planctomycetota bacterium]